MVFLGDFGRLLKVSAKNCPILQMAVFILKPLQTYVVNLFVYSTILTPNLKYTCTYTGRINWA